MPNVDVVNPDSTDPLALSEDRDRLRSRDVTASDQLPPAAPAPVPIQDLLEPPPEDPPPVVVDTDMLQVSDNPNIPRVYPNIPAHIVPPTGQLNTNVLPGSHELFHQLSQANQAFQQQQEFQLDANLQTALNDGELLGISENLYREQASPLNFESRLPQTIQESVNRLTEQQLNIITPSNIDPESGEVVPGTRNVMERDFGSNLGRFISGEPGKFEETLSRAERLLPPLRAIREVQDLSRGLRAAQDTIQSRNLAARILGVPSSVQIPVPFVGSGIVPPQRGSLLPGDIIPHQGLEFGAQVTDEQFIPQLIQNSLVLEDLATSLATPGPNGVRPLQGEFGEFGSAGLRSGLFWGLNLAEGTASGALYELTNRLIEYDRDDPVRIGDAFLRGRDLGFTNQADDNKYLSTIDNPRLERIPVLRNTGVQIGLGFAADIIWGGVFDFGNLADTTFSIAGRAATRAARRTAPSLALVPLPDVAVAPSTPIPNVLQAYRANPQSVQPFQLNLVPRTDEQLSNVAATNGLTNGGQLTPFQIHNFQLSNPDLMSRYGNAIPDAPIPPRPTPLDPASQRAIQNVISRRDKVLSVIDHTTDPQQLEILNGRLQALDRRLRSLTGEAEPTSVQDLYIQSLTDDLTPTTDNSEFIARQLSDAESQFVESTQSARYLQSQNIQVEEILEEQRQIFDETFAAERTTLRDELATRNNYQPDGVPNVASRQVEVLDPEAPPPSALPTPRQTVDVTAARVVPLSDTAPPPRNIGRHLQDSGTWYHGTKSIIDDVALTDYTRGSSVSNELGPGLYLTTDPALAREFAQAIPVVDKVPNPSLRTRELGEVIQVNLKMTESGFVDASQTVTKDSPIRKAFIDTVKENLARNLDTDTRRKLVSAAQRISNKKPLRDWLPELRINYNRLNPDAQSNLVEFNRKVTQRLADSGVFGTYYKTNDGHIVAAIYNNSVDTPLPVTELNRTTVGTGLPEEQVYSRYLVDRFANEQLDTRTTKANVEASKLSVDTLAKQNLDRARKEAYTKGLDDTQRMLDIEDSLEATVRNEQKRQLEALQENSIRNARTRLRKWRGNNQSPCV